MAELQVIQEGAQYWLRCAAHRFRCVAGAAGLIAANDKQEGDNATPRGRWPLRGLYYRADRIASDRLAGYSAFSPVMIGKQDGWCDDPEDAAYNMKVNLPYSARHETLWREDGLYDLIIPLGYNDTRPVPHKGSAIFLHCAPEGIASTKGCVALAAEDLLVVLNYLEKDSYLVI